MPTIGEAACGNYKVGNLVRRIEKKVFDNRADAYADRRNIKH